MSAKKYMNWVEIDQDFCNLNWGVAPCLASFSTANPRKCYNTYQTCTYTQAYDRGNKTLRFVMASYPVKSGNYIPALVSVGGREQEVNIAGFSDKMGGLGVRGAISVVLRDFPSRDTLTDPYFAERMDGTAQTDEPGYDPYTRGSFWTKWKARNPNYAGRSLRVYHGYMDDAGELVTETTRHYVMDEFTGPDTRGNVTIKAKDILSLADDKKALAPRGNQGRVLADMEIDAATFTLSPAGIGNSEYSAAGYVTVGSEIMRFNRTGDVMTVTRGEQGTQPATHNANDTVQMAFSVERLRADEVIRRLLINYGNIPASYIDFAEWQAEFDRWGASMILSATICKPTGVSKLIGEINQLGITVWWDEIGQKIRIKLNRPPDTVPAVWTDRNNIISITTEDNDNERATRVELWTVQIDPTKDLSKENFLRGYITVSVDSESPNLFGLPRTQTIYNRWLNHGADAAAKIITGRLLNRYKRAPVTYNVKIDVKDDPELTDVITLQTHVATDITGKQTPQLTQVYYRSDDKLGSTIDVRLQGYQFDSRYGLIAENTRGVYNVSTPEEKLRGSYFVGPSLVFDDGTKPYRFA